MPAIVDINTNSLTFTIVTSKLIMGNSSAISMSHFKFRPQLMCFIILSTIRKRHQKHSVYYSVIVDCLDSRINITLRLFLRSIFFSKLIHENKKKTIIFTLVKLVLSHNINNSLIYAIISLQQGNNKRRILDKIT